MIKIFLRFFFIIVIIILLFVTYLSYFGLETDRFDNLIKNEANKVNQNIKLEFQKTKIHLSLSDLNLAVKLQKPKINVKNNKINLSKLDLFLSMSSYFSSDFLLKRAEIAFIDNDIKDLAKVTNIFLPKYINKQFRKIFEKGSLAGEFIIPFKSDGSIANDYGFSGKVSNATINFPMQFSLQNLTTLIKHKKKGNKNFFDIEIEKGNIYDFEIANSKINVEREKGESKIQSSISTNGNFNFSQIRKISSLFGLNIENLKDVKGATNLKTNIDFNLNKKFKIKNLTYSVEGNIANLDIDVEGKKIIKKYLPDYNSKIILKNTSIKLVNSKSDRKVELNGFIKVKDSFDNFEIREVYNYNKKKSSINGIFDLTNSEVNVSNLNYTKEKGKKSEINFDLNYILNKHYIINNLNFLAGKTQVNLSDVKLNSNFEIKDFKKLKIKTFKKKIKNNDFFAEKSKKIIVTGDVFDAQPLIQSLFKKVDKKTFSKNFNSEIKINLKKTLTGTNDNVSNFAMIANIKKGSFDKLSLKGNFSKGEIVEMSIYQIDKDKKTLQLISDRARPFVKNFDFIKGFEGGKLEYESIISNKVTNSNLTITDFKVSKVPALAQLLTLASLQGIADTLSGEGIRFESFEMKSNSEGNVLNIEDILAMGPAVSILMEGYVDKGKIVSLRGTLVPATKLNAIISSIPLVGEILVGKKTGEGVVGVSFKMKGPPKDIKTTVNPIKTLTPRFIVRAVEKMKKKKREEVK